MDDGLQEIFAPLAEPQSTQAWLAVLERFIEWWHGPNRAVESYSSEQLQKLQLPSPLRWWYERFGRGRGIISGQNFLLGLDWLSWEDAGRRLIFYDENQNVYEWSTESSGDDPPVWVRLAEEGQPWRKEESSLSAFLIQACLLEATFHAPCRLSAETARGRYLAQLTSTLTAVPLGAWHWPAYPSRFYVKKSAIMFTCPNRFAKRPDRWSVWIGAKVRSDLEFFDVGRM